ncbi:MAG: iron-containing alcohol dehydrogenase [Clostridia bacterium]|jgi:alcohol dehydrogenase|nr:iron-containing alcohol dehydrogenase [Clostridia bacterium]
MQGPCRINTVSTNFFGEGALSLLPAEIKKYGYQTALVITDKFLYDSGVAGDVCNKLSEANVHSYIYNGVLPNPTTDIINECLSIAYEIKPEFIVALGGGSAIDTCKAVGIVLANGGNIEDYEGINKSKNKSLPIVAINTTAGTGSEVTTFYIITDKKRSSKMVMVDTNCMVSIAVNDAALMRSMPKSLTAATGMDAMTHAVEAILSKEATPFTDKDAVWAIRTIREYLPRAATNGEDMEARNMMAYAQYAAGIAFSNAGLGMVHAMAHALGGYYNLPHGLCNAVLLPHVMQYNGRDKSVQERFRLIYDALGLKGTDYFIPYRSMVESINDIKKLSEQLGIPERLSDLKVNKDDFEALAGLAVKDACMSTNAREASLQDIITVYDKAY